MADYNTAVRKAEQLNRKRRRESGVEIVNARMKMSAFLYKGASSLTNLLLDGNDRDRNAALYRWLEQLYASVDAADYPVVVTGPRSLDDVIERLISNVNSGSVDEARPLYWIRNDCVPYEFFLGMNVSQIQEVLSVYAENNSFEISDWLIFASVCDLLEKNGYELTLANLNKMYQLQRDELADLFSSAGMQSAALACSRDSQEFFRMQQVLQSMMIKFDQLGGRNGSGISIIEKVQKARAEGENMPVFYIPSSSAYSRDLLEYLSAELRQISSYTDQILVLESVGIEQDTKFWKYISRQSGVHLTLSSSSCLSMLGGGDAESMFEMLDGIYDFLMILLKSTNDIEKLTRNRSVEYDFVRVSRNVGVEHEFMRFLPRGRHDGYTESIEKRRNLRNEDMAELPERGGCIVVSGHTITIYMTMIFD